MKRTATAIWRGNFKEGKGTLSTASSILKETPYSFSSRFENSSGTNPEELISAAHAGCFTMALSAMLNKEDFTADQLSTEAALTIEQVEGNWTITTILLTLHARIPNITEQKFKEIAENAKANCPVSRVLNAKIILEAHLDNMI
jgi:osmotically inducible protein OsmC